MSEAVLTRRPGIWAAFATLVARDVTLAVRRRSEVFNPLVFFVIVVTLFPLSLGPEVQLLQRVAPGIIWVAAMLAAMLSLENIFHADFEDGSLEQLLVSPHPVVVVVLAKICAHWLMSGVPLILLAPLLGLLLHVPAQGIGVLMITLLLGTPILSLIGAVGVALTLAQRRGGVLLSLLVLPLYIPPLIFGAAAVDRASAGLPVQAHLSLLGALLALAITLAPWAAAAAVRIVTE
ncbi:MAG TPA: heme exporter protein CcmB [Gammaproteobacteria bacterium]|nr:heme exporter protein CcmB [Gammaproteobacteria bacterium]